MTTASRVWHYDGRSGDRYEAVIAVTADGWHFTLDGPAVDPGPYAFADLLPQSASGPDARFSLRGRPGWRIGFIDAPAPNIAERLPKAVRYGRAIDRFGLWQSVGVLAVIAVLIVVAVLQLPAIIASLIPRSTERQMGLLLVGNFGSYACSTPAGDAAVKALTARLDAGDDVTIRVVRVPVVNAVAFPGGQVVLFDGLIQQAKSPDEVAGVLGHELGHVAHRDGLEALIRQFGLSMALGGIDGNVGAYSSALLSASYSRKAESRADDFAIETLRTANISPAPTAQLFARLGHEEALPGGAERVLGYLESHPLSREREARFTGSASKTARYTPALTPAQWQALRTMCAERR
ncbi:M48 family metallopeptidase [Sphingomonas sp. RS6]